MNRVILSGNLCRDIEVKMTTSGKMVVQNAIAVKSDFKNADGEYDSTFVDIVIWGASAEYISKYAEKGSKILVEGRLNKRNYEKQDGTKVYVTEVICEKVELLTYKKENTQNTEADAQLPQNIKTDYQDSDVIVLNDNDLPF